MKRLAIAFIIAAIISMTGLPDAWGRNRRRMTPVDNPATTTQAVNETRDDTSRINAKRRANSVSYVNESGVTVFVDTTTNTEWIDSSIIKRVPKMKYPLLNSVSAGIDVWDPIMRVFGQQHGIAGIWGQVDLHNRYFPTFEMGLGYTNHKGPNESFVYNSPLSVYFKIGADYNFLFNSNPDYKFFAGFRYGFSPFSYSIKNVKLSDNYWDETVNFNIPSQNATAGWIEFGLGLRVKIAGPVSVGWMLKYHSVVHQSKTTYGDPWYIPGFGSKNSHFSGSVSVSYTFDISHLNKLPLPEVIESETPALPDSTLSQTDSIAL